ncbi:MAG: hypothetical protein Ct9H300mP17_10800 [Candidatus Nitrosopelagicus sp.]|nr:MAG: hypothetical protein Ct9H300mP17_10800 [Candidatus Nitrosopelagicus sp.]
MVTIIQLSDDFYPFDDGSFIVMIDGVESDYTIEGDTIKFHLILIMKKLKLLEHMCPEFYKICTTSSCNFFYWFDCSKKIQEIIRLTIFEP